MKHLLAVALLLAPLSSCATTSASYVPPRLPNQQTDWSRSIQKPFDEVWEALIDHASGTFFAIDNFEKESGLLTLSFGGSRLDRFVDGGDWEYNESSGMDPMTGRTVGADVEFDGNYATFLQQYRTASFTGKMNIFVRDQGGWSTEVKVRARYVVTSSVFTGGRVATNIWSFDTGGFDTVHVSGAVKGTEPSRTLRPTHKAERSVLEAIESFGRSTE